MSDLLRQLAPVQRHAGGLHTLYVRLAPGARMDGHRHDEPTIVLVRRGRLHVCEGGTEIRESAGTLRLSQRGTSRAVRTNRGADCLIISCHSSQAVARHAIWRLISSTQSERHDVGAAAAAALVDVATCSNDSAQVEAYCLALLTRLQQSHEQVASPPPWLDRALVALSDTGGRRGACRDVARAVGVHPVHLARVVRRFTGLTIRDLLRRERVVRAAHLLRSSKESLSAVAHRSGFADHSHFTREFVWRHGQTPSAGRRSDCADVVSIQASDFPAVHLGRVASGPFGSTRRQGDAECDGEQSSRE